MIYEAGSVSDYDDHCSPKGLQHVKWLYRSSLHNLLCTNASHDRTRKTGIQVKPSVLALPFGHTHASNVTRNVETAGHPWPENAADFECRC